MKIPPDNTKVLIKCLSVHQFTTVVTPGNIYEGVITHESSAAIIDTSAHKGLLILFKNCAIGTWEIVKENKKNDIWDALVASCKR